MELVYLWVEKYKDIKEQGFNFSPKYNCYFKSNIVINYNKKDYINILPNDINSAALAGENGSGKSSILELIAKILSNDNDDISYILIIKKDSLNIYTNLNIQISDINNDTEESFIEGELENQYFIYQSSNFVTGYFDNLIDNFSSQLYKSHSETESTIKNQSWLNQFLNSNRILQTYSLDGIKYRQQHSLYIDEFLTTFKNSKVLMQLNFISKFPNLFTSLHFPDKIEISIQHNNNTTGIIEDDFYKKVEKSILNYHNKKSIGNGEAYNGEFNNEEKIFLKILETLTEEHKSYDTIVLNVEDAKKFINTYTRIKINIFDVNWYDLSSGEDAFLNMYTLLLHGLESLKEEDVKTKNVIISFDEIENNFHPLWQKKIVVNILRFLQIVKDVFEKQANLKINIQLIFATHSPFILSDFSKENILFLEKGKEKELEIETFGENIHTLLSHGFFMKDGLMGEFAKTKIQEIIKYHEEIINRELVKKENKIQREEEKLKYVDSYQQAFWNIQSIIGDTYLKQIIKNHMIEIEKILLGNDKAKELEIDRLKKQINLLESL